MKCILTYFQDSWGGGLSQHLWVGPLWPSALHNIKSGLRRVRNCMGRARPTSFYVCHNKSTTPKHIFQHQ